MIITIGTPVIGLLIDLDQYFYFWIDLLEAVKFILPGKPIGNGIHGWMILIHHIVFTILYIGASGVTFKISSCQLAIPRPFIFCIGRCVYSHISATGLNEAFKIILLFLI